MKQIGSKAVRNRIKKAFSPEKGLVFAVNGVSAPPPPKFPVHAPGPLPPLSLSWGLSVKPPPPPRRKGGRGRGAGGGPGAEASFTAKTSPFFGSKAAQNQIGVSIDVVLAVALGWRTPGWMQISREKLYTPPPPPPFLAKRHFPGDGGWGCIF